MYSPLILFVFLHQKLINLYNISRLPPPSRNSIFMALGWMQIDSSCSLAIVDRIISILYFVAPGYIYLSLLWELNRGTFHTVLIPLCIQVSCY